MKEIDFNTQLINELIQKRGASFRKFYLYPDKIKIETRTIRKVEKVEVKLEKVGFDIIYQADNVIVGKIWFFICLAAPIILDILQFFPGQELPLINLIILHVVFWLFALFNFLKQHQDDIILDGQNDLVFYRNIPNEQKVLEFIEQVKLTTKELLKRKYLNTDNYIDEKEFKYTMNWLLERDIISKSEYKNFLNEYKLKNI
jgi:hypothetical protein